MRDSCVMYEDQYEDKKNSQMGQDSQKKTSPQKIPHLNYHASNERSQLSDEDDIED